MTHRLALLIAMAALLLASAWPAGLAAQDAPKPRGSSNIQVVAHVELEGPSFSRSDIEIEQELSRPYAYVGRILDGEFGFDIISLDPPTAARRIYSWRIEDAELHQGLGGMDPKYFKLDGRYYLVQSLQFFPGGPNPDLGAVVVDVTGLPDTTQVREVGRIRDPEFPGGFHNIFAYKHSDGRVLLFATSTGPHINVFDMARFLAGDEGQGLIGRTPWPVSAPIQTPFGDLQGYHDMYAAYDPIRGQDKLYGAGYNGYYVWNISRPEEPELIATVAGTPGLDIAHQVSATPDGRFLVSQTEYLYSPIRIFDILPALEGEAQVISEETGVWTANWRHFTHNHEIRWPFVFVAAFADGMQVFNMRNPELPTTVGYYDTYPFEDPLLARQGLDPRTWTAGRTGFNGAWGVNVRNADGLIVASDFTTGFWAFRMDGFDGWNGEEWGMPNVSGAQDWDNGPPVTVHPSSGSVEP